MRETLQEQLQALQSTARDLEARVSRADGPLPSLACATLLVGLDKVLAQLGKLKAAADGWLPFDDGPGSGRLPFDDGPGSGRLPFDDGPGSGRGRRC